MTKTVAELGKELDEAVSAYGLASYREGKAVKVWGPCTDQHDKAVTRSNEVLDRVERAMSELVAAARAAHEVES